MSTAGEAKLPHAVEAVHWNILVQRWSTCCLHAINGRSPQWILFAINDRRAVKNSQSMMYDILMFAINDRFRDEYSLRLMVGKRFKTHYVWRPGFSAIQTHYAWRPMERFMRCLRPVVFHLDAPNLHALSFPGRRFTLRGDILPPWQHRPWCFSFRKSAVKGEKCHPVVHPVLAPWARQTSHGALTLCTLTVVPRQTILSRAAIRDMIPDITMI